MSAQSETTALIASAAADVFRRMHKLLRAEQERPDPRRVYLEDIFNAGMTAWDQMLAIEPTLDDIHAQALAIEVATAHAATAALATLALKDYRLLAGSERHISKFQGALFRHIRMADARYRAMADGTMRPVEG